MALPVSSSFAEPLTRLALWVMVTVLLSYELVSVVDP